MDTLAALLKQFKKNELPFLVVGGHAIAAHGVSRQTADLDLLVRESQKTFWQKALGKIGYREFHNSKAFLQYEPLSPGDWPIDLILVDESTFSGLQENGVAKQIGGITVTIPCTAHMLALKLHALKQDQASRELKDLNDIIELVLAAEGTLSSSEVEALCQKFGPSGIYPRIVDSCERRKHERD